jgi:hypothetical protein
MLHKRYTALSIQPKDSEWYSPIRFRAIQHRHMKSRSEGAHNTELFNLPLRMVYSRQVQKMDPPL